MNDAPIDFVREVLLAERRIRPNIRTTPLDHSPLYSELGGANVYFKCENLQHTGSFKARGAMNKILSLSDEEREMGVVTASSGNHGAGFAFSLNKVGAKGTVFLPEIAQQTKIDAIRRLGAEVQFHGDDSGVTEVYARQYAADNGKFYVSPYNDPQVAGGQGTIGVEICRQLDQVDAVFVSVGGGGLISGIASYVKHISPETQIVGCTPFNSKVMMESVKAGEILDLPSLPTLSDGTAGGVEAGSITFEPCRDLIDQWVTVTEDEIADSMQTFMSNHHQMIEGSAAVAIASFLKIKEQFAGKNVVIVLCGANVGMDVLKSVL